MNLSDIEARLRRHRTVSVFAALALVLVGVDLLLDPPKAPYIGLLGVPFLVAGLAVLALVFRRAAGEAPPERRTLASRLLDRVTLRGRLTRYFPLIGIAVIAIDLAYNLLVTAGGLSLGTEDTMVLLFAAVVFAYPLVPARYGRERDFVLMFVGALVLILVLPLLLARLYYQDWERSVDIYSWVALAPETAAVLNLLGVPANVHAIAGTAPGLTFTTKSGIDITVVITTACSGIYSFGIFASAFVAFVVTEYERFRPKVLLLLGLGFLTSYVANILRMVLIVLFGVYGDSEAASVQNLLVAHSNLGWIIFLAWIALFWGIVFKFFVKAPTTAAEARPAPRKHGVLCGLCGDALTPALPGYRCECGKFYHVACASTVEECPRCHRPMKLSEAGEAAPAPP